MQKVNWAQYKAVENIRLQNFLEENNVFPSYEVCGVAYYRKNRKYYNAMDKFNLMEVMKNRL